MRHRALVVGSQTLGLEGPRGDAERMARALEDREFKVDLRVTDIDATREGILDGYQQLVERTQLGDAVVIYFSGHGVRVLPSAGAADVPGLPVHAIVPSDFETSSVNDFRGITDVELSALLAQLTHRTPNVTLILDCGHAAVPSRNPAARPKALLQPSQLDMRRHLARMTAQGLEVGSRAAEHSLVVRLVAAGPAQSAYERDIGDEVVGTFTESLVLALRETERRLITWDGLIHGVRERVLALHPDQRPDVEGPTQRYLFAVQEAPRVRSVTTSTGDPP